MAIWFNRVLAALNPLGWAALSLGSSAGVLLAALYTPSSWNQHPAMKIAGPLLLGMFFAGNLVGVVGATLTYRFQTRRLGGLVSLYLAIPLIFANLHFLVTIVFQDGDVLPIAGIHPPWTQGVFFPNLSLDDVLLVFIDCVHYSVVTFTTLGYGDMQPTAWYAKLLSDVEVLLGVIFVAVALGKYFAYAKNGSQDA